MINVLHLRDTDRICGPGKTILETASAVNKREFTLFVGLFLLQRETRNVYMDAAIGRGINVVPLVSRHQFDPALVRRLLRVIDEHDIHLIHSHEYKSDILTWLVSRGRRIPIMTTVHGWILNRLKSRIYNRIGRAVLPSFDRVVAVSEGTRQRLLDAGVPARLVTVIHNAIVTQNYDPAQHQRGYLRSRFSLPDDALVVGNIGRLSPEKGQHDMLAAAAAVAERYPRVHFVFVGDGPDGASLEQAVRERGLEGRVHFTGHLGDVRPVYADIDILALTSHTEGFPNVVLEALCMDRPVVATDVGGTGEIVRDGETGILIPAHQPEQIARGLRDLIEAPALRGRLAAAGRALVQQQFAFNTRVAKEEAVYRELVLDGGRGGSAR